jgi:uncharacterized repeat protein (TIGR03803 family)
MKKFLLLVSLLSASFFPLYAQSLFGTTPAGGAKGGGAIIKFAPTTNTAYIQQSFQKPGANPYYTTLTPGNDGKLYGMTFNGGANNSGVIFSYDPAKSSYNILYDFYVENGAQPAGSLIQASDGKLYGMAVFGGNYGYGVIFSFDIMTMTYTKLFDFQGDNGSQPNGSLFQNSDGKMYGMASSGGLADLGVIFSFDPTSLNFTKLFDFDMANGGGPSGSFIAGDNGLLYGMCDNGGSGQGGVIFAFNPANSTYAKLKDFDFASGYYPYGNLMKGADGKFYGMTYKGGDNNDGVLFSFDETSGTYSKLNDFDGVNGADPLGSLVQTPDGKIYGTTSDGGILNAGVIFYYDPVTSSFTKLKDFKNSDGKSPFSSLVMSTDRKFYGTTFEGGIGNDGVIFSLDPSSGSYTKLKDLGTNIEGLQPYGALLRATDGKLYGMTAYGGSYNDGVIYSFDPNTSVFKKLMDFDSTNGAIPYGSFIQATNGKLYAMTNKGGTNDAGIVFSYDPSSSTFINLYNLNQGTGDNPYGSLLQASDGKLYGLTSKDGNFGGGSIFSFDLSSMTFNKLKDLDYLNGGTPYGNLVQASTGKLYGITEQGGEGYIYRGDTLGVGVIFSFDLSNSTYKKVRDLDYLHDGGSCYGSLIKAKDGKLYAMASNGGYHKSGVIFSVDPQTDDFTKLYDFGNEAKPLGNLFQAGDGQLYASTNSGGYNNLGVIFSLDPSVPLYSDLLDYTGANGAKPDIGSAFIEIPDGGPLPVTITHFSGKTDGDANGLFWETENEESLSYYELQRSRDGQSFTDVFQTLANGNTNYSYNDYLDAPTSPVYFYRLKMVDKDGHFKYSDIIKLSRNINANFVKATPNPFKDRIVVTIKVTAPGKVTFVLTDLSGSSLLIQNNQLYAGTNVFDLDEAKAIPKGIYLLRVVQAQRSQTIKIVKGD